MKLRSFLTAPIIGAFLFLAPMASAQIENVHTYSGGHGVRALAGTRLNASDPGSGEDKDDQTAKTDFTDYTKELTANAVSDGDDIHLEAHGRTKVDVHATSSATSNRAEAVAINSIAQQASPIGIGQRELARIQLIAASTLVKITFPSIFES